MARSAESAEREKLRKAAYNKNKRIAGQFGRVQGTQYPGASSSGGGKSSGS